MKIDKELNLELNFFDEFFHSFWQNTRPLRAPEVDYCAGSLITRDFCVITLPKH